MKVTKEEFEKAAFTSGFNAEMEKIAFNWSQLAIPAATLAAGTALGYGLKGGDSPPKPQASAQLPQQVLEGDVRDEYPGDYYYQDSQDDLELSPELLQALYYAQQPQMQTPYYDYGSGY